MEVIAWFNEFIWNGFYRGSILYRSTLVPGSRPAAREAEYLRQGLQSPVERRFRFDGASDCVFIFRRGGAF